MLRNPLTKPLDTCAESLHWKWTYRSHPSKSLNRLRPKDAEIARLKRSPRRTAEKHGKQAKSMSPFFFTRGDASKISDQERREKKESLPDGRRKKTIVACGLLWSVRHPGKFHTPESRSFAEIQWGRRFQGEFEKVRKEQRLSRIWKPVAEKSACASSIQTIILMLLSEFAVRPIMNNQ